MAREFSTFSKGLAIVILGALVERMSPQASKYAPKEAVASSPQALDTPASKSMAVSAERTAKLTTALVVVGVLSAASSAAQWWEIRSGGADTHTAAEAAAKNADTAQKTLIAAQRAWIGVTNVALAELAEGKQINAIVEYRNFGRDPATMLDARLKLFSRYFSVFDDTVFIREIDETTKDCMSKTETKGGVVFPSGSSTLEYKYPNVVSDDPDLSAHEVLAKRQIVILTGCFTYRSQQTVRRSAFCFFYREGETKTGALAFCPEGNDAD